MNKTILIGGGVAVVAVIAFIAVKARNAPSDAEQASGVQLMPDTGYMSMLAPSSGGSSSGDYGAGGIGQMPSMSEEGNSGSSDYAGGFDMMSLFASMFKGQQENEKYGIASSADVNKYSIQTGGYNFDSAVLAGIIGTDGVATVKHDGNTTTVTNTPNADPYQAIINNIYKTNLGRDPDLAGSVYWKNALMNNNISITGIVDMIHTSPEYQNQHQPTATNQGKYTPPPESGYQQSTTTTTTDPETGAVVTTAKRT